MGDEREVAELVPHEGKEPPIPSVEDDIVVPPVRVTAKEPDAKRCYLAAKALRDAVCARGDDRRRHVERAAEYSCRELSAGASAGAVADAMKVDAGSLIMFLFRWAPAKLSEAMRIRKALLKEEIVATLTNILRASPADLLGEDGSLRDLREAPRWLQGAVEQVDTSRGTVKMVSKLAAAKLLMKIEAMDKEEVLMNPGIADVHRSWENAG